MRTKALNSMADYCSKAEHCTDDVRKRLAKFDLTNEERNDIVEWLTKERFIDDCRYAKLYAREKARFNGWGPQKIRFQLIHKHISNDIINEALAELTPEVCSDRLCSMLANKARSIKDDDPWKRRNKLIRFGLSRGFDYDTVLKSLPEDIASED